MAQGAGGFKIENEAVADKKAIVVKVHGDIDAHTTKLLRAAVEELFSQKKHRLVIDFSHVNYMSSAGASLLIIVQQDAQKSDGKIVLTSLKLPVQHVFDLLGLTPLFTIVKDRKAALAAM